MQLTKTQLAAALVAVTLISTPFAALAASFVRVPITQNAQIDNGGLSPASSSESGSVGSDSSSTPVTITAAIGMAGGGGSTPPGIWCTTADYSASPGGALYSLSDSEPAYAEESFDVFCMNNGEGFIPGTYSFTITPDAGTGPGGDRLLALQSDSSKTLRYQLYANQEHTQIFGSTPIHTTVTLPPLVDGESHGKSEPLHVYVKLFAQDGAVPGGFYSGGFSTSAAY